MTHARPTRRRPQHVDGTCVPTSRSVHAPDHGATSPASPRCSDGSPESPVAMALGSVYERCVGVSDGLLLVAVTAVVTAAGVFADRQRDRPAGQSPASRSRPQLRLRRRPVRAAGTTARFRRRWAPSTSVAAVQRRGLPVRAGRAQARRSIDVTFSWFETGSLERERAAGRGARRDDHRHRRRAAPGVPGPPRRHGAACSATARPAPGC